MGQACSCCKSNDKVDSPKAKEDLTQVGPVTQGNPALDTTQEIASVPVGPTEEERRPDQTSLVHIPPQPSPLKTDPFAGEARNPAAARQNGGNNLQVLDEYGNPIVPKKKKKRGLEPGSPGSIARSNSMESLNSMRSNKSAHRTYSPRPPGQLRSPRRGYQASLAGSHRSLSVAGSRAGSRAGSHRSSQGGKSALSGISTPKSALAPSHHALQQQQAVLKLEQVERQQRQRAMQSAKDRLRAVPASLKFLNLDPDRDPEDEEEEKAHQLVGEEAGEKLEVRKAEVDQLSAREDLSREEETRLEDLRDEVRYLMAARDFVDLQKERKRVRLAQEKQRRRAAEMEAIQAAKRKEEIQRAKDKLQNVPAALAFLSLPKDEGEAETMSEDLGRVTEAENVFRQKQIEQAQLEVKEGRSPEDEAKLKELADEVGTLRAAIELIQLQAAESQAESARIAREQRQARLTDAKAKMRQIPQGLRWMNLPTTEEDAEDAEAPQVAKQAEQQVKSKQTELLTLEAKAPEDRTKQDEAKMKDLAQEVACLNAAVDLIRLRAAQQEDDLRTPTMDVAQGKALQAKQRERREEAMTNAMERLQAVPAGLRWMNLPTKKEEVEEEDEAAVDAKEIKASAALQEAVINRQNLITKFEKTNEDEDRLRELDDEVETLKAAVHFISLGKAARKDREREAAKAKRQESIRSTLATMRAVPDSLRWLKLPATEEENDAEDDDEVATRAKLAETPLYEKQREQAELLAKPSRTEEEESRLEGIGAEVIYLTAAVRLGNLRKEQHAEDLEMCLDQMYDPDDEVSDDEAGLEADHEPFDNLPKGPPRLDERLDRCGKKRLPTGWHWAMLHRGTNGQVNYTWRLLKEEHLRNQLDTLMEEAKGRQLATPYEAQVREDTSSPVPQDHFCGDWIVRSPLDCSKIWAVGHRNCLHPDLINASLSSPDGPTAKLAATLTAAHFADDPDQVVDEEAGEEGEEGKEPPMHSASYLHDGGMTEMTQMTVIDNIDAKLVPIGGGRPEPPLPLAHYITFRYRPERQNETDEGDTANYDAGDLECIRMGRAGLYTICGELGDRYQRELKRMNSHQQEHRLALHPLDDVAFDDYAADLSDVLREWGEEILTLSELVDSLERLGREVEHGPAPAPPPPAEDGTAPGTPP